MGLSPGNSSCVTKQSRDFSNGQNSHIMVVTIASDEYKGRSSTASIV